MIRRVLGEYAAYIASKYPVVTITGPRQSGKTTLARSVFADKPYANLEDPVTREFAQTDPKGFLVQYHDGAVIDEIQRVPELLSHIQVMIDARQQNGLFIVTGSHQFDAQHSISQSLAGRTALLKLLPFSLDEALTFGARSTDEFLYTGFYPRIYDQDIPPTQVYGDYFETYVERDLRQIITIKDLRTFQTFVRLCAGRIGQLLNLNSLASDTGISQPTARQWLSILENSFIVFTLQPYHANIRTRLVKSPKLYFYDIGLAAWLCGIEMVRHVSNHPLRGNFFENLVIAEVLKYRYNSGRRNNMLFYRDSGGNEVDLLYTIAQDVIPIEIKSGLTIASDVFTGLKRFEKVVPRFPYGRFVVYPGDETQQRSDVKVINYMHLTRELKSLEEG